MTPDYQNHRKEGQGTWQMHKDPASTQPRSAGSRSKVHTSPLKQKSGSNTHPATLASPKGEEAKEAGSGAHRTSPRCHSPRRGRQGPGLMRGAHQGPSSAFRRAGSRAQQRSNVKRGTRGRENKRAWSSSPGQNRSRGTKHALQCHRRWPNLSRETVQSWQGRQPMSKRPQWLLCGVILRNKT